MLSLIDLILSPFVLIFILFVGYAVQTKGLQKNPIYRYYFKGLALKLFAAIAVCLVYTLYYKEGGDATNYFYYGGEVLYKLFLKSPSSFFKVVFGERDGAAWQQFDSNTGWPYYSRDANSFFVVRIVSLISLFTFKSYIATSLILAWFSYSGLWRFYRVFSDVYPKYYKQLALAVLFIPSVAFWGSGLLKDTITLSAIGWYIYSFYSAFIKKSDVYKNLIFLIISSYLILAIKPYVFYALMPGSLIWLSSYISQAVMNPLLRKLIAPLIFVVSITAGYFLLIKVGKDQGKFEVDKLVERAIIIQKDLKRAEAYGNNYFDIGEYDPSLSGLLKKAHIAITAGLFRPFIWEVRNPLMLLSGLENLFILILAIGLIIKAGFIKIIKVINSNPLILFSLIFVLLFSFSVGITSANFGALVRYKIPVIPFFVSSLLLIRELRKNS